MITARNYAAQAVRDIRILSETYAHDGDRAIISQFADNIEKATHFVLPNGGRVLDDELAGIDGVEVNLPYKIITVEFFDQGNRCLVLTEQNEHGLYVTGCIYLEGLWRPLPLTLRLSNPWHSAETGYYQYLTAVKEDTRKPGSISVKGQVLVNFDSLYKGINRKSENVDHRKYGVHMLSYASHSVFELVEALSCRNVSAEPIEKVDPAVNARRVKAGKLPIYETKMLVIRTGNVDKQGQALGGTHASPRQHLRRGHIRRLPGGNVWINACVVGDPTKGRIDKQYTITRKEQP